MSIPRPKTTPADPDHVLDAEFALEPYFQPVYLLEIQRFCASPRERHEGGGLVPESDISLDASTVRRPVKKP